MTCTKQTMWKVGIGLLLGAGLAYAAVPEFRAWILVSWPFLAVLICPLSMLFGMKAMNQLGQTPSAGDKDQTPPALSNADRNRD